MIRSGSADELGPGARGLGAWSATGGASILHTGSIPEIAQHESSRFVFASGRGEPAVLRQTLEIGRSWLEAIRSGRVKVEFSARLGGESGRGGSSRASVVFLNGRQQEIGRLPTLSVGSQERAGRGALVEVRTDGLPPLEATGITIEVGLDGTQEG